MYFEYCKHIPKRGLLQRGDRFVIIIGSDWQGAKDYAYIANKKEALEEILKSGNMELLERLFVFSYPRYIWKYNYYILQHNINYAAKALTFANKSGNINM